MSGRGEEPVGRIELVGDGGLVATVDPDQWPVVGGNAAVRMNKPDAVPWPGELLAFARAKRLNIEWTLKSGERRSLLRFALDSEHFEVGSHIPVASPRYTWDGRVVDADPAVGVTIRYRIQSGAERTKVFFAEVKHPGFRRGSGYWAAVGVAGAV